MLIDETKRNVIDWYFTHKTGFRSFTQKFQFERKTTVWDTGKQFRKPLLYPPTPQEQAPNDNEKSLESYNELNLCLGELRQF